MSKYDKDTKFYWMILQEDFFDEDSISWLEEQKPNGRDYAYFYLKLCLKALKTNGILVRRVGQMLVPYDNNKLAEITKIDFDTVTIAMTLLQKIGLVKILENGEIYLPQLEKMIGEKSKGAFKKQQQREALKGESGQMSTEVSTRIRDRDRDRIRNKEIDIDNDDRLDLNNNKLNILNKAREKIFELGIMITDSKLEEVYEKAMKFKIAHPIEYIVAIVKNEVNQ